MGGASFWSVWNLLSMGFPVVYGMTKLYEHTVLLIFEPGANFWVGEKWVEQVKLFLDFFKSSLHGLSNGIWHKLNEHHFWSSLGPLTIFWVMEKWVGQVKLFLDFLKSPLHGFSKCIWHILNEHSFWVILDPAISFWAGQEVNGAV